MCHFRNESHCFVHVGIYVRMYTTRCYLSTSMSRARNVFAELGNVGVLPGPYILAVEPLPSPRSSPRCLPSQCWWCSGRRQGDSIAESRRWSSGCKDKGQCVNGGCRCCLSVAKERWQRAAPDASEQHRAQIRGSGMKKSWWHWGSPAWPFQGSDITGFALLTSFLSRTF